MKDNFDLKKFLIENKLTPNSLLLKESAVWNWDGDRNSLEQVPPEFKEAVKAALPDLDDETFEAAFDGIKNFHADEAGKGSMRFNSDHWAEQIEMDYLQEDTLGENEEEDLELDRDYDKGGKYYSEDGAEAFRIQPFKMNDIEYTKHEANRMGRYIVGLDGEALKQFISDYMGAFEADKGETEVGQTFTEAEDEDHHDDGDYPVQEAFKKAGIDMSKEVHIHETDGGTPGRGQLQDKGVRSAESAARYFEDLRTYEIKDDTDEFPIQYEYSYYGDAEPEGKEFKMTFSIFEGTMWDIFQ